MSSNSITLSPNDLKKINKVVCDISDQKTKMEIVAEAVKDLKKTVVDDLKESGLTAARLNLMIRIYHDNKKQEYFDEQSDLEALYDNVFPSS